MSVQEAVGQRITLAFAKSLEIATTDLSGCCIAFALDAGLALRGKPALDIDQYRFCARVIKEAGEMPLYQVVAKEQLLIKKLLDSIGVKAELEYRIFAPSQWQKDELTAILTEVEKNDHQIALIGITGRAGEPHLITYLGKDGDRAIVANNQALGQRNAYAIDTLPFDKLLNQAMAGDGIYLITLE